MKKTLLITALMFGTIAATAQTETAIFSPAGYWTICESQHLTAADTPLCAGFSTDHEPWMLILKPSHASTSAFRYSITGIGSDGKPVVFTGLVNRSESGNTIEVINAGHITSVVVAVEELTAIAQRRSEVR